MKTGVQINKNLWDPAQAVGRGKLIVANAGIKEKISQINNLNVTSGNWKEKNKLNPAVAEENKERAEINETESRETTEKINKTKTCSIRGPLGQVHDFVTTMLFYYGIILM